MPELVRPTTDVRHSYLEAVAEFRAEGRGTPDDESMLGRDIRTYGRHWHEPAGFAAYAAALAADAEDDTPRPAGFVPSTTLWYVEGDTFLGRVSIRHRLTRRLLDWGGLVGYDVRPTARRRGHATAMLRAALPVARRIGHESVLVTCDHDNVGSRRVIEANGGVFEDRRGGKLRYWIGAREA
ncbi:GNAT family N-acetyltransferase [Streptomyces hainanensis]|uniref:GNAT family N-acetyltransferase n=1 Tax=Streptomyces hainanensis TaxID=402648 RepID=A0A4R4TWB2_9ACTN|nr:GNAT family N-acetyltransferase [Streptomyces hainanensis]TDC80334.1 GNAT family N-acetyltransferase [Streptomyces hainanensis]